jgi:hypothetical protein
MIDRIASTDARATDQDRLRGPSTSPSVDDMSEWSFPASDPPATWTWDVDRPPRAAGPSVATGPETTSSAA